MLTNLIPHGTQSLRRGHARAPERDDMGILGVHNFLLQSRGTLSRRFIVYIKGYKQFCVKEAVQHVEQGFTNILEHETHLHSFTVSFF